MMRIFFDSSAFVKRCNQKQGSEDVLRGCDQATELGLEVIALPERVSALCRLQREERLGSFFDRPPPDLPPLGGGENQAASVPSPNGGGLGWGRVKSLAPLSSDRPPPKAPFASLFPPMGGGVNAKASVPSPNGGGLGWGQVKSEDSLPLDRPFPSSPFWGQELIQMAWQAEAFITADSRQSVAAQAAGLKVVEL